MTLAFFFLGGLIVGSFLNVVIWRLQSEETLWGRSMCRSCRQQIAWYDNIPVVSFLFLRGKCRSCRERISWQYPAVELATAFVFTVVGRFVFSSIDPSSWITTGFYLILFSLMMVIFVYDLLTMYVPMVAAYAAIFLTAIYLALMQWFSMSDALFIYATPIDLVGHVASGLGAFAFFYAMVVISKETWMGMGDAYLALLVGLVTGWAAVLWTLTLAFGSGALIGLVLIALGKKGMKSQVPFAPFLMASTMIMLLFMQMFPVWSAFLLID